MGNEQPDAVAGGPCVQTWDGTCEEIVVCSMVVICPHPKDKRDMYSNEQMLRFATRQHNVYLSHHMFDVLQCFLCYSHITLCETKPMSLWCKR